MQLSLLERQIRVIHRQNSHGEKFFCIFSILGKKRMPERLYSRRSRYGSYLGDRPFS